MSSRCDAQTFLHEAIILLKHIRNIDICRIDGGTSVQYDKASGLQQEGDLESECWVCKSNEHWSQNAQCPFNKFGITKRSIHESIDDMVVRYYIYTRDLKIKMLEKRLMEYKEKSGVVSNILRMSEGP